MKRTLITGGAGFIGYHLTKELLAHGYDVVLADNFSRGVEDNFLKTLKTDAHVTLVSADLTRESDVLQLGENFDYIFHLAAMIGVQNVLEHAYSVLTKNAELTIHAIELAKRQKHLKRFVFASTSEVYAGTLKYYQMEVPTPEDTPLTVTPLEHPRTSYMLSKIYGEALLQQSLLPFTIIRPHNFYGPRMGMSHVIPELLQRAFFAKDTQVLDVASPTHKRTFCYIDDAVGIIRKLAEAPDAEGQTFNVGNEMPEVTIREVADIILSVVGKPLEIVDGLDTPGSPARRCPNMSKTRHVVGDTCVISLEEGIQKTFDWYREYIFEGSEVCER